MHLLRASSGPVAARTYIQLAEVNAKNDNEHESASNYVDAAKCFINNKQQGKGRVLMSRSCVVYLHQLVSSMHSCVVP